MSRTHERAYALLAERVRPGATARRALYATITVLTGSGIWWLYVHFGANRLAASSDEFPNLASEALALKVHGAAAFATLFALGAMSAYHIRRGWVLKRNRVSGSLVVSAFILLTGTGYALYYLVSDDTHAAVSILHWAAGLAVLPMLIGHILVSRHARRGQAELS